VYHSHHLSQYFPSIPAPPPPPPLLSPPLPSPLPTNFVGQERTYWPRSRVQAHYIEARGRVFERAEELVRAGVAEGILGNDFVRVASGNEGHQVGGLDEEVGAEVGVRGFWVNEGDDL